MSDYTREEKVEIHGKSSFFSQASRLVCGVMAMVLLLNPPPFNSRSHASCMGILHPIEFVSQFTHIFT